MANNGKFETIGVNIPLDEAWELLSLIRGKGLDFFEEDLICSLQARSKEVESFARGDSIRDDEIEEGDRWVDPHREEEGTFTGKTCTHGCCWEVLMDDGTRRFFPQSFLPIKEGPSHLFGTGHVEKKGRSESSGKKRRSKRSGDDER